MRELEDTVGEYRVWACERPVQILVCTVLPLALILVVRDFFPPNYFFDSEYLHQILRSSLQPRLFGSFVNLSWLMGLLTQTVVSEELIDTGCGVISAAFFAYAIVVCRVQFSAGSLAVSLVLATVFFLYLAQFSKELLVLAALVFALQALLRGRWLAALCILTAYALFARRYWLLIVALWGVLEMGRVLGFHLLFRLVLAGVGITAVIVLFHDQFGYSILSVREIVNAGRHGEHAVTIFQLELAEYPGLRQELSFYLASIAWYTFPHWLLAVSGPQYVVAFLLQVLMTCLVVVAMWRSRKRRSASGIQGSMINLVIAIYSVLLLFEPDAGSFMKHQAPLIPILLGLAFGEL